MSYRIYDTEGFILGSRESGEADMFLFVYTKEFGMVRVLAKSMRLEKSKLRGHTQLFSRVQVQFVAGRQIYRLIDAGVVEEFPALQGDLFRFQGASAVARFCKEVVSGEERDEVLWRLLEDVFTTLGKADITAPGVPKLLYMFQIKSFRALGYLPEHVPEVVLRLEREPFAGSRAALSLAERREIDACLSRIYMYAVSPQSHLSLVP